jgi:hypothetical protein
VFATSAFGKLRSRKAFAAFAEWLSGLPVLTHRGRRIAVRVIAASEVVIVVLVALPWTARAGLLLAAMVLAVFAAGTFIVVRAGVRAPCQCFGTSARPLSVRHGVVNMILCAAAAAGLAGAGSAPARPAGLAISLGCALAVAMLVLSLDDLVSLLSRTGRRNPSWPT